LSDTEEDDDDDDYENDPFVDDDDEVEIPKKKAAPKHTGGGGGCGGNGSGGGGDAGGDDGVGIDPSFASSHTGCGEKMVLPHLKFGWIDGRGQGRYTILVHLPAGSFRKKAVMAYIRENKRVHIIYDYSHLKLIEPNDYNKAFKDENDDFMYDSEHARTVRHSEVVRTLRKDNRLTKCKAEMIIELPVLVENDWIDDAYMPGFQIFKVGPPENPQIFAHMELMCKRNAFNNRQPVGDYEDFLDDDSDSSA
jgi:hypothetical protein